MNQISLTKIDATPAGAATISNLLAPMSARRFARPATGPAALSLATRTAFALVQPAGLIGRWTLLGFTPNGQSVAMGQFWTRDAAERAASAMRAH